ncbi:channel protein TolC [Saccharobesus litoralis]|uniref:Channel protein TolC n=1 Tax=Saccharobesus litoralis TaxID=2172099 RepID=A0A2S0VRW5_9ALTE|nr:TolC family outer membrane protein [Saccharobesus litoralis]AWB66961.1 channel protein TolC [Saccharobesus litoralis]
MKKIINRVAYATLALVLCQFSFSVYARSLEQTVAVAFNTNPDLKQVYHNYKAVLQEHNVAQSGWYPTLDLEASIGVGRQDSPESRASLQNESIKPLSYGLTLSQLLFDGFFTSENIKRTDFEAQSELFQLKAAAENKALEVVNAYLNVIKDQTLVDLSLKNTETHQQIQQQIQLRHDNGLGSVSDLSQANGRLARAQATYFTAQNNLADSVGAFIRLVGEKPNELILPVPDAVMLPVSEGQFLDKAKLNHPTIKSAIADIKAAQAQLEVNKSPNLPTLTAQLSHTHTDDRNNGGLERTQTRADLVLSYNLYRGGQDQARVKQFAYVVNQAQDIKDSAQRQVVEGAQFSWNSYSFVSRQIEFLQTHVEQSFITKQAYKEQFEFGRRTLLDLLDTENELFEARRNFVTAETEYLHAHYRLFNAMGELLTALRINGDEYWQLKIEK